MNEEDDCQQAQTSGEHRFSDDEHRRVIALDMAIRVRGDADNESIVKTARAFEAYLNGEPNV